MTKHYAYINSIVLLTRWVWGIIFITFLIEITCMTKQFSSNFASKFIVDNKAIFNIVISSFMSDPPVYNYLFLFYVICIYVYHVYSICIVYCVSLSVFYPSIFFFFFYGKCIKFWIKTFYLKLWRNPKSLLSGTFCSSFLFKFWRYFDLDLQEMLFRNYLI